MEAKYLKITIHDNDFTGYADILASAIKDMFKWLCWVPTTDESLEKLKPAIANVWTGLEMVHQESCSRQFSNFYDYIMEHIDLSIVDFENIPDSVDNYEDVYIPLFEYGEIFVL